MMLLSSVLGARCAEHCGEYCCWREFSAQFPLLKQPWKLNTWCLTDSAPSQWGNEAWWGGGNVTVGVSRASYLSQVASQIKDMIPCPKRRRGCAAERVTVQHWWKTKDWGSHVSTDELLSLIYVRDHLCRSESSCTGSKMGVLSLKGDHIAVWEGCIHHSAICWYI